MRMDIDIGREKPAIQVEPIEDPFREQEPAPAVPPVREPVPEPVP